MFHAYRFPTQVGWLGWFEDSDGNCTAFVDLANKVTFLAAIQ